MTSDRSSPIADWVRLLCREVRDQRGVKGVGVIGMCLTGNFAIQLIGDDSVLAAVASQPAMPFFKQGNLRQRAVCYLTQRKLKADVLIAPLIAAEYLLLQRRVDEPNQTRQPLYINYSFS